MNPKIVQFATAVSNLLKVAGMIMVGLGWNTKYATAYHDIEIFGGAAMIAIPAVFDVLASGWLTVKSLAIGTQAGINLTQSGNAVDQEGKPISEFSPSATPPKPVTETSALQIVKDYGPSASDVKK